MNFVYTALPYRVVFEAGALNKLPEEAAALGQRALVLSTPEQRQSAEDIRQRLGARAVAIFDQAKMHVPTSTVADALAVAKDCGADFTVAIGGGSTIGLAKALSLRAGLSSLAIPTTYAGSEMTPIWGLTEGAVKETGRDPIVVPRTVIYDPQLTLTLPVASSITSALNAMAHCIEGLYAIDGNPIVSLMAQEGLRALYEALPRVKTSPADLEVRGALLYGAWLAGTVLGAASVALHHKLCHTLGGAFNMPHAETHAAVLPHAVAYNAPAVPDAMARAGAALGTKDVALALYRLSKDLGVEMALKNLGMPQGGALHAARLATQKPYPNPRPVTQDAILALLERAYEGQPPKAV